MTIETDKKIYRAPALEKGLDILELLSNGDALSFTEIVQKLGRSHGELFRMTQVLEARGYIEQSDNGLRLTSRLFELGLGRPPVRNLVEVALPIMRDLSIASGQSCHLALLSKSDIVVIARMEAPQQIGFSVRIGYRKPLTLSGSGLAIYAFQSDDGRAELESMLSPKLSKDKIKALREQANVVREVGTVQQPSSVYQGITDVAAPIMRGDKAIAALTIPYLQPRAVADGLDRLTLALRDSANAISNAIRVEDNRA
ncbi:IclR family transcriptional regulator [Sphingopyxis yananensis]|uniref:IclR family transcriptional regulator n=1 Tax=Sphingopyxis yananensis TaxID=2886687 RepID=UPI001D10C059|nr:IclR family transcriptional regulator [Sphingopyxis yananensis]MCC2603683.1 IclR family transcriptional regulator [Sphingopyxis yananensis]